jgi:hypothetical protein
MTYEISNLTSRKNTSSLLLSALGGSTPSRGLYRRKFYHISVDWHEQVSLPFGIES